MSWGTKKQLIIIVVLLGLIIAGVVTFFAMYNPLATCFDKKQNQAEEGADCGGPCDQPCKNKIVPLRIVWTRIFPIAPGEYDFAAMVLNPNIELGTKKLKYTIRIVDKNNVPVIDREGQTFVNPGEKFVIYESGVKTGSRTVGQSFLLFESQPPWTRVMKELPTFSSEQQFINGKSPRLQVALTNNALVGLKNVSVVAILSDKDENAYGASMTMIDNMDKRGKNNIFFTWPNQLSSSSPVIIDIYPRVSIFDLK